MSYSFDAVIFDLDGVITQTALVHAQAWKAVFDGYLRKRERERGEPFVEFTHAGDYLPYVDGKPRYKGVESFLKSRGIEIPFGSPSDSPDLETCCGIGNSKNIAFNEELKRNGVKAYDSTVALLKELKKQGVRLGVASSSKNCRMVLEAANLLHYFETRVDGEVSAEIGLKGKPEPDIFTKACDNLGASYDRSVVVEDAVSGVQAGRMGNFGLVIGIARENNHRELREHGADIVVTDLAELKGIKSIEEWFRVGLERERWAITYTDYDREKERSREALLTVGNGYFGTRGSMEEVQTTPCNYPGTYMAGVYNRLTSKVGDRNIENEDLVNTPSWLPITFKIEEGEWLDPNSCTVLEVERRLNLRTGELHRLMKVRDEMGRETLIESGRFASMASKHHAAIYYSITPLNYQGYIRVKSGLSIPTQNDGVKRYASLNQKHLTPLAQGGNGNTSYVAARTTQSAVTITQSAKLEVYYNSKPLSTDFVVKEHPQGVDTYLKASVARNETLRIEKLVCLYNSPSAKTTEALNFVLNEVKKLKSYPMLLKASSEAWEEIWNRVDVKIIGDRRAQQLVRLHVYHTFVTTSPHNQHIDSGIPARGLHGEAYRGHILRDELYIFPFHCLHYPEIARAVLMYRYNRLPGAREYARKHGYEGAMFPWQSGSDGREETPVLHLNPNSGEWGPDHSALQRHVSIAIALNVWTYFHITKDLDFISGYGAEIFFEICRFWSSLAKYNPVTSRYEITGVMGPDEFHDKLPGSNEWGVKDNAYSNIMVVWLLRKASELMRRMDKNHKRLLFQRIGITQSELDKWEDMTQRMNLVISPEGIISQFDGYFNLKELDWEDYRGKYTNIQRLDRILKAEGRSPNEYKVSKQADTLMAFYCIDPNEVLEIICNLGYSLPDDFLAKNFDYYIGRCSHGSTHSRVVHSFIAMKLSRMELGWSLYQKALESDFNDIQGGTTSEGIHLGVMTGTVLMALTAFAGIGFQHNLLVINPNIPKNWRSIKFKCSFRGNDYALDIAKDYIKINVSTPGGEPAEILTNGVKHSIDPYRDTIIALHKP